MRKKFWFLIVIVLLIIIGGFFYFWIPNHQSNPSPNPPTLFGKDDYKVEERDDGKYIVVDKVGLTAKVPDNWDIKFEGNDYPEPEYWVDLYSPDAKFESTLLIEGCGINIMIAKAEETVKKIEKNINLLENQPEKVDEIRENYNQPKIIETITIDNNHGLKIISQESELFGQNINIDIPIDKKNWVSIAVNSPLNYRNKCFPIWEEFIENLKIK